MGKGRKENSEKTGEMATVQLETTHLDLSSGREAGRGVGFYGILDY